MLSKLRKLILGKTLKTEDLHGEKLNVFWGLTILSSDAISSVAYAGEAILAILIPVIGSGSYEYMFYVSIAIVALLLILVFSYRQTIESYPNGGGSYIVAHDNLGVVPGLVAGSSLSVDYILTVAVSVSAGTAAITSAFPALLPYKVLIALLVILLMTIGNLRGMKESARLFGIPTYIFIATSVILIIWGIVKYKVFGIQPKIYYSNYKYVIPAESTVTIFLILRAFASGCTALTGVEAVSNGIPNFKEPSQKNAERVLLLLGSVILFLFAGIAYLATIYKGIPNQKVTVLAQIASGVYGGSSIMFYIYQLATSIILIIAANTAYADLPLLLSLMAKDGYAPRQFATRGKRLSFSNGIIMLWFLSSVLVIIFKAEEQKLLPLYALGVFISFTLSQGGMFKKWVTHKTKGWRHKAAMNGVGTVVTFITGIVIGATKFKLGAWVVCIIIPTLVLCMLRVKRHYNKIAQQLKLSITERPKDIESKDDKMHVIILVDSLSKSFLKCYNYSKHLSKNIVAFHVSTDEENTERLKEKWKEYNVGIPLVIKYSPYRDIFEPLVNFIESEEHASKPGETVTVVMSQFVITKWWHNILHNQTALFIKSMLYRRRNIVVISVPYIIEE